MTRILVPRYRFTDRKPRVIAGDTACFIDPSNPLHKAALIRQAAQVFQDVLPDGTENQRQLYIAQGWLESYLGGAGHWAPGCSPTWNWGACRNGHEYGTGFITLGKSGRFATFDNMEDGFRNYLRVLPDSAEQVARDGKALEFATILANAGYYGPSDASPVGYAKALISAARPVAEALGEPLLVSSEGLTATPLPPDTDDRGNLGLAALAGLVFAASIYGLSKA